MASNFFVRTVRPHVTKQGFTLIELLVVIAIIGLLASIVLVLLSSARLKSRDSNRVVSLQEMAKIVQVVDTGPAVNFTGCTATVVSTTASLSNNAATCIGPAPISFINYKDPSKSLPFADADICTNASAAPCQYMIATASGAAGTPTTQNFEVCTYVEGPVGRYVQGMVRIGSDTGGSVVAGCN